MSRSHGLPKLLRFPKPGMCAAGAVPKGISGTPTLTLSRVYNFLQPARNAQQGRPSPLTDSADLGSSGFTQVHICQSFLVEPRLKLLLATKTWEGTESTPNRKTFRLPLVN